MQKTAKSEPLNLEGVAPERRKAFTQAQKIAERFGATLNVAALENGAGGRYLNGQITIDPTTENPVRQVLVHELTHQQFLLNALPIWANEGWAEYVGYVPYVGEDLDFAQGFSLILHKAKERAAHGGLDFDFKLADFFTMDQQTMYGYMPQGKDTYLLSVMTVAFFVHLDGKKGVAQKVVYAAFDLIKEKTEKDPVEVFTQAMENIMPSLEVKARRVGGANYQVPMEVRPARRQTLGLRWLTTYSRNRSENTMKERLAAEILDAANNTGASVKKREDVHKMADANKAFAHFRW